MKSISLFIFSIILLTGCQNYKVYYYTAYSSNAPRIYEYTSREDSSKTQYWRIREINQGKGLLTEGFNENFHQFEFFEEKIGDEGSTVKRYISYNEQGDSLVRKIIRPDVFKWKGKGPYQYAVEYENGGAKLFFQKNRTLIGTQKLSVLNKEYNCLKFKGVYQFGYVGQKAEYEYYQYSYYAKGIGMVKYERYFPDGETTILELSNIYSDEEWKDKINTKHFIE